MSAQEITEEQRKVYEEAFNLFDKDGSGHITEEEVETLMRYFGDDTTQKEINDIRKTARELLKKADTDNNDSIDFNEFVVYMQNCKQSESSDESNEALIDAFKVFDKDGNGTIDANELKTVMTQIGEALTDAEVKSMIDEADKNGDGVIDYKDFQEAIHN